MQRIAVKCLVLVLAGLLSQSLPAREAVGAECGDVYPGARVGPPPEWSFWADGSACFVRWAVENPDQEEELLEQCRNTPGARFVHFEPAEKGRQSICIFKVLDTQTAEAPATTPASPTVGTDRSVAQPKNPPADELSPEKVLEEIEAMVRARNEECLARERANDPLSAGSCWKIGAEAVGEFIEARPVPGKGLKQKLAELQATWIARAGQLEGRGALQGDTAVRIEPSSTKESQEPEEVQSTAVEKDESRAAAVPKHQGPDPNRLSATSACSSATLGSRKHCVSAPVPKGSNVYEVQLNPDCTTGSIAAIGTTNERGKCVRKVVTLSLGEEQLVESHAEPTVVDAITYEPEFVQCYSRRHENISCDGKIDYEDTQTAGKPSQKPKLVEKKRTKKQKQASRRKATKAKVAAVKEQTKPTKIRKKTQKSETALKVTTNYTRKPELGKEARKQPTTGEQSKPSIGCRLFSNLC